MYTTETRRKSSAGNVLSLVEGHMNAVMDYIRDEWRCYRGGDVEPDWTEWTLVLCTRNIQKRKAILSADISLFIYEYCIHLKNYRQRQWCKAIWQSGKKVVSYRRELYFPRM